MLLWKLHDLLSSLLLDAEFRSNQSRLGGGSGNGHVNDQLRSFADSDHGFDGNQSCFGYGSGNGRFVNQSWLAAGSGG